MVEEEEEEEGEEEEEKVRLRHVSMIILTSLLQLAQSSVECMIALMMAQAAGERLRSGVGRISRRSGGPRA